ncbi:MAG: Ig-like domain repeat protein [Candidatus Acidiferrales bacterium]
MRMKFLADITILFALIVSVAVATSAQSASTSVPSRITQAVDEHNLTTLKGNTHPFARPAFDRGAAPGGLAMNRILLVLQRSPDQEAALEQLLDDQQNSASPQFHQWLTPQQFGQQFGPSDQDIQTITSWLQSHGFQVSRVAQGRVVIEFSGTASQVQDAFHTSIHKYEVNGEQHWANATDPQIPAALAPVVGGIVSLHNFPKKAAQHFAGVFRKDNTTGAITALQPAFTFPSGCTGFDCYFGLGPYDFATIYNVLPLWKAGVDGTGQTIAIVQESNINITDVQQFRKLFGLPKNDPEIILDGPDPGIVGDESEALIDVSWSGAVAKNAKIKMVVSATTNTTQGIDLSAEYIVDNNIAPIMSESYLGCELGQGTAGNQYFNAIWQQAAAQGITVFIAAGDNGSAGCDDFNLPAPSPAVYGLQVNGIASTPYDVAVGGTDFYNSFFNPTQYWNLTNNSTTQASALSYIPEIPWNDSCTNPVFGQLGFSTDPIANCNNANLEPYVDVVAGSGGVSACTINDGQDPSSCKGGYAKPSWQSGVGVPHDKKRDLPDVSLFASNGFLGAFYIICEADVSADGTCNLNAPYEDFAGYGGTSVSSPAFAGIMALIDQKTNVRQGNANYVLYKLAAQQPVAGCNSNSASGPAANCIFNDITQGTNSVPCVAGSPNCNLGGQNTLPLGVLAGYDSGAGYDLTTGLGSVNAANLVNNWKSVTFKPTSTLLSLTPRTIVHGQTVKVSAAVISAQGVPSGQIALLTTKNQGLGAFTLDGNGGLLTTINNLPGGTYGVEANFAGNGIFAQSDSSPVSVTVFPEPSITVTSIFSITPYGQPIPFPSGPYGSVVFVRADVSGRSGYGIATGNVNFTDNNVPIAGNPFALNAEGNTYTVNAVTTFLPGVHSIRSIYSGDLSFIASVSQPVSFQITKAQTQTALSASSAAATKGGSITLTATVSASGYGNPPGGSVEFFAAGVPLAPPVRVTGSSGANGPQAVAVLQTNRLSVGADRVTASYQGDVNYDGSVAPAITITVSK